jgi:hypothetical protein
MAAIERFKAKPIVKGTVRRYFLSNRLAIPSGDSKVMATAAMVQAKRPVEITQQTTGNSHRREATWIL